MNLEASHLETDSHHIEFDLEVKWPDINQVDPAVRGSDHR